MIIGTDSLLLVCKDEAERNRILEHLKRWGYDAAAAGNVNEALDYIHAHHVDLVLVDSAVSEGNGTEALETIRRTYAAEDLPVILLVAKTSAEEKALILQAGANDFIAKPIVMPVLLARIQTQLSRKRAEEALRESEQRYALAARVANDGLWDWDLVINKIYFSPRWKALLGWEEHEISNDPDEWFRRIHPDDIDRVSTAITAHLEGHTPQLEDEYRILHRDGNYLWMHCRGLAVRGPDGKALKMVGSQTDITRGKVVDILTGLPNRVLFMDRLGRSFERARRQKDRTIALIFLDLDSFKLINDSHGHMVGDQILVAIAGRLEASVRASDTVVRLRRHHTIARLGGDEFTILLEDISCLEDATKVADRIARELAIPFMINGRELFVTASMGIALCNPAYHDTDELLRDADTAMYSAKALGKGRYEVFDPEMRARAVQRTQMSAELQKALEKKEFEIHYQSVVSLETGKIWGFEALVRWRHAERGIILPREFLPLAEESGLIVTLGKWILETACQQMRNWQIRFPNEPALLISINLSPRQLVQSDLVQQCRTILDETRLSRSSLNLEFTERVLMHDPEAAVKLMCQLKSLGVRIALDDFGTGYSSIGRLGRFPIDSLKVDGSFVARMMQDDEIIRTLITLGRNLGLLVIAEGVETAEQATRLRELGCELAQGYYFSAPLSAREATNLLAASRQWAISSRAAKLILSERNSATFTQPGRQVSFR